MGGAIRRHRLRSGRSLRALAAQLGVSPATLSAIETGRTPITVDRLRQVAALLEVPVTRLMAGESPAAPGETADQGNPLAAGEQDWRDHSQINLDPVQEAAARVFVRQGFHGSSMRDIAAAAGLSVAGVYHHHASKHGLMVSLLDVTMAQLHWRVRAARDQANGPVDAFAAMVESLALFHAVRGDLAFLGASEMRALKEPDRSRIAGLRTALQHLLDDQGAVCAERGDFTVADPVATCRAIATMCTALPSWFRTDGPIPPALIARDYAGLALRMMGWAPA